MFQYLFVLLLGCVVLPAAEAQNAVQRVNWKTLQAISYQKKFYKEINDYMMAPVFTEDLKNLDGKVIEVEGYVVPFDETGKTIVLSANPYAACFFCGKAGPASVMTIKLKNTNKKYETDDYHHFRGTLRLNYSDINDFYYIMEQGEVINQ